MRKKHLENESKNILLKHLLNKTKLPTIVSSSSLQI